MHFLERIRAAFGERSSRLDREVSELRTLVEHLRLEATNLRVEAENLRSEVIHCRNQLEYFHVAPIPTEALRSRLASALSASGAAPSGGRATPDSPSYVAWGELNDNSLALLAALREIGISLAGIVCDRIVGTSALDVPIIPREKAIQFVANSGTSVLMLDGVAQACGNALSAGEMFTQTLIQVKHHTRQDVHAVHPVAFSDRICGLLEGHIWHCGYGGSGNVIAQRVLSAVVECAAPVQSSRRTLAFTAAASHFRAVLGMLEERLNILGRFSSVVSPEDPSRIAVTCEFASKDVDISRVDRATVFHLPGRPYLWTPILSTHEFVTSERLTWSEERGIKTVVSVRDPLDTIVSIASKVAFFAGPERDPIPFLDHERWFTSTLENLGSYLSKVVDAGNRVILLRYEDLIENPTAAASYIANRMQIQGLVSAAALRDLPSLLDGSFGPSGHRWRPGVGKWKEFLTRKHLDYFLSSEACRAATALGYVYDIPNAVASRQRPPREPEVTAEVELGEIYAQVIHGKASAFPLGRASSWTDESSGITVAATSRRLCEEIKALATDSYFQNVIASASVRAEGNLRCALDY